MMNYVESYLEPNIIGSSVDYEGRLCTHKYPKTKAKN